MNSENQARIKSQQDLARGHPRACLPDLGPPPKSPRRQRGLVAQSDRWVAEYWDKLLVAAEPTLTKPSRSPTLQLFFDGAAQYASGPLLELAPPVVRRLSPTEPGRLGVFHPRTGRDAFIEALIGRPVPQRPLYQAERPIVRASLRSPDELMEWLSPAMPAASRLSPREQVRLGQERLAETIHGLMEGDAFASIATKLMQESPEAFASSPLGHWLLGLLVNPSERDAARPPFDWEFVTVGDLAPGVAFGIAWWDPSDFGARRHRRAVAAHLRYLFDYRVAPWNRYSDPRARREAAALLVGRSPGETVPALAERLRSAHSQDYLGEEPSVTVARLHRANRRLRSARKALGSAPAGRMAST